MNYHTRGAKYSRNPRAKRRAQSPSRSWWRKHFRTWIPATGKRGSTLSSRFLPMTGPLTNTRLRLVAIFVFGLFFLYELFLIPEKQPPNAGTGMHQGTNGRSLTTITGKDAAGYVANSFAKLLNAHIHKLGRETKGLSVDDTNDPADDDVHDEGSESGITSVGHEMEGSMEAQTNKLHNVVAKEANQATIDDSLEEQISSHMEAPSARRQKPKKAQKWASTRERHVSTVHEPRTGSNDDGHIPSLPSKLDKAKKVAHQKDTGAGAAGQPHSATTPEGREYEAPHGKVTAPVSGSRQLNEAGAASDQKGDEEEREENRSRDMEEAPRAEAENVRRPPSTDTLAGVDAGSTTSFMDWFQTKEKEDKEGDLKKVDCPEGLEKKLCESVFKVIRKHKVRTLVDISCHKNRNWMPVIISKVQSEIWGFKYFCSDENVGERNECKETYHDSSNVEFLELDWWTDAFPKNTDMVLAWDTLRHSAYGRIWTFFQNIRKSEVGLVLLDNFPSVSNEPSPTRKHVNVRRHPFKLPAGVEVFQRIGQEEDEVPRQLTLYEIDQIPASRRR